MNQHIFCIKKACDSLGIPYSEIGKSKVFLKITTKKQEHYFIANEIPLNNHIVHRITEDKSFTEELLSSVIRIPRTLSYIDPACDDLYKEYLQFHSQADIVEDIRTHFPFPVILKKNSGSQGINVFRCTNKNEIQTAVHAIYDKNSLEYDHVLLAQQHIEIKREFRVTVFQQKIRLVYEKDFSQATFIGNLSPFHWEGAKAHIITDKDVINRIDAFISPIYTKLNLNYGGLDIAIDTQDHLWMFEINSKPAYNHLIHDNGEDVLIDLYKEILKTM